MVSRRFSSVKQDATVGWDKSQLFGFETALLGLASAYLSKSCVFKSLNGDQLVFGIL